MGELLQSKPDGFASSLGEGAFGKERKLYRTAKGPISEGAVTVGDWGSWAGRNLKSVICLGGHAK